MGLSLADHPALQRASAGSASSASWNRAIASVFGDAVERSAGGTSVAGRRAVERAKYAGDPWGYISDVLGWWLTPQQEAVLDLIERETRVLVPSGNNLGKTFELSAYGVYVMDAVAALPDEENGMPEQGARILLPGPDHDTVFETIYSEMLTHAARAESRGYMMPGIRSERSVLWRVRPKWHVEVLSPPKSVGQAVAHTASGRHHRNQIALVEEGQGVAEPLWRAAEGMCSTAGNKIVSSFNPTEPIGPAYQRARSGAYRVIHLDAFQHPNVVTRQPVVPDAVDYRVIDARVRSDCRDRGTADQVLPESDLGDFLYALPRSDVVELPRAESTVDRSDSAALATPPRIDGVLGALNGTVHVYRPSASFVAQVRGQWPTTGDSGLFATSDWDAAVERWLAAPVPTTAPDRVGLDSAREGRDDSLTAPSWGLDAGALLRSYALAEQQGPLAIAAFQQASRVRVGELEVVPKGDGPDVAAYVDRLFPASPFVADVGGVGSSPFDHLVRVLGRDATGVSFAASPSPLVPSETWSENMRTQLYVRAAMLVRRGLVDVPDDPLLREEMLAHETKQTTRTAEVWNEKKARHEKIRVPSIALIDKDEIKRRIGRSPDRADAFVLSLFAPEVAVRAQLPGTHSYRTLRA